MKLYIKADAYNELIEKGYGKRDLSKLTRKVITDKNGHRRTVFVRNDIQTVKRNPSINNKEDLRVTKYDFKTWLEDNDIVPEEYEGKSKNEIIAMARKTGLNQSDSEKAADDIKDYLSEDSKTDEEEKNYYELIETLNGYDRTDPDELEKYKRENERLHKLYPKDKVKNYIDYAKKQLFGSKEDIKNYLGNINIKNPSNLNYYIAEIALDKQPFSLEKLQSDLVYGDITLDEMAEKIYENIHPEEKKTSSETKGVNVNDIDKFLFNQDKNNIRNAVKDYLQKNPDKKEKFLEYVSKKHDEAVSKKDDADVYLRYAKNEEDKKKYQKEWDKWNNLVNIYGKARYYNI